ncbi:hypothetical protein CEUSTIGMA_g8099.t1 [Chlamydomonas eustigma]|uniref:U-box domain-containing protein n=1 Tax=Chlamydomonas eustigma TaxID=1157962 RepID=A0A250XC54_9CHLO|nr:hypothetical protein CEUSTIGMA_g8099.t1 [Chlamydomonas eustigma]|eukprot:GAX80664.1 hypothetical protein CEUSTIGMA_g8099.t1 [Chlamydomonas eustigma]
MGNSPSSQLSAKGPGVATLDASTALNFTPSDGFFLMDASKAGNHQVLELFLSKNPALVFAKSQEDGSTPWHYAAQEGHAQVLELLTSVTKNAAISNTFDPVAKVINCQNTKGQTSLMLACRGGHFSCVKLLLSNGAIPTMEDVQGLNSLHYSALGMNAGCTLQLLKKVGLWGAAGPQAVAASNKESNKELFSFINGVDAFGRTPLHYAAWVGDAESAVALMGAGANILAKSAYDCYESSLPCNSGTSPLHLAAMKGHRGVAIAIIAAYLMALQRYQKEHYRRSAAVAKKQQSLKQFVASAGVSSKAAAVVSAPLPSTHSTAATGGTAVVPSATTNIHLQLTSATSANAAGISSSLAQVNFSSLPGFPPPPPDPRVIRDTYTNTPLDIAASRKHDDGALMRLLDPSRTPLNSLDDLEKLLEAGKGLHGLLNASSETTSAAAAVRVDMAGGAGGAPAFVRSSAMTAAMAVGVDEVMVMVRQGMRFSGRRDAGGVLAGLSVGASDATAAAHLCEGSTTACSAAGGASGSSDGEVSDKEGWPRSEASVNFTPALTEENLAAEAEEAEVRRRRRKQHAAAEKRKRWRARQLRQSSVTADITADNNSNIIDGRRAEEVMVEAGYSTSSSTSSSIGSTDQGMLGRFYGFAPRRMSPACKATAAAVLLRQGAAGDSGAPAVPAAAAAASHFINYTETTETMAATEGSCLKEQPATKDRDDAAVDNKGGTAGSFQQDSPIKTATTIAAMTNGQKQPGRLTTEIGKHTVHMYDLRPEAPHSSTQHPRFTLPTASLQSGQPQSSHHRPPVPDCFLCPLTLKVLRHPVVAADGVTYEEEAILKHFRLTTAGPAAKTSNAATVTRPVVSTTTSAPEALSARPPDASTSISSSAASGTSVTGSTSAVVACRRQEGGLTSSTTILQYNSMTSNNDYCKATSPLTRQVMPHDGCPLLFPNRALRQAIEFWVAANDVDAEFLSTAHH